MKISTSTFSVIS